MKEKLIINWSQAEGDFSYRTYLGYIFLEISNKIEL